MWRRTASPELHNFDETAHAVLDGWLPKSCNCATFFHFTAFFFSFFAVVAILQVLDSLFGDSVLRAAGVLGLELVRNAS